MLKHIELFAGCGGMSLGLEKAGFMLYFANELSPMAGETFAFNILNESLENHTEGKKTLWLKSQFPKDKLEQRLRENPFEAVNGKYSDIEKSTELNDKLLIGDINVLLEILNKNKNIVKTLKKENIDLISGGPPCQSFSLAGKREKNNYKNTLPLSFAQITGLIQPKTVLLENVKGITSPFTEDGTKYYAWLEVAKAFTLEGYVPICMMVNSKYFGVAQNRPRYIMIAYRKDIFDRLLETVISKRQLLENSLTFYDKVRENEESLNSITISDLRLYDIESKPELFDGILLPKTSHKSGDFVSASEAIDDLRNTDKKHTISKVSSVYGRFLNSTFSKSNLTNSYLIKNHIPRHHRYDVRARFRFYQVISEFKNGLKKSASDLFVGKEISEEVLKKLFNEFAEKELYFKNEIEEFHKKPESISDVQELIKKIPTKKHSQRALNRLEPAPAQLTIPDDLCHYHSDQLRTMTVREMARFQSFPDWFEFKSKITTGGQMRKFEVPQYTQVGNAVPPLLAKTLGELVRNQLIDIGNG